MILTFIYLEFSGFPISDLILHVYWRTTLTPCWVSVNKTRKYVIEFLFAYNLTTIMVHKVHCVGTFHNVFIARESRS